MTSPSQIEVMGSDGHLYFIVPERIGYGTVELSLIPHKIRIDYDHYCSTDIDIHKGIIEQYITNIKRNYAPERHKISTMHRMLNSKQINNHFDYLHLLQQINPILNELLAKL